MKTDNPFDCALDAQKGIPENVREQVVWVTDTLDLCWASAKSVFEKQATPELALAIFDRVVARIGRKR